jgi:hypothetical protein
MGKTAGLSVGEKTCVPTKYNILLQASRILPTILSFMGKPISWHCVQDTLRGKKK